MIRSGETEFRYERTVQPPKIWPWRDQLNGLLLSNEGKLSRERLTLIRIFEELGGLGYEGRCDAVRRYAKACAKEQGAAIWKDQLHKVLEAYVSESAKQATAVVQNPALLGKAEAEIAMFLLQANPNGTDTALPHRNEKYEGSHTSKPKNGCSQSESRTSSITPGIIQIARLRTH